MYIVDQLFVYFLEGEGGQLEGKCREADQTTTLRYSNHTGTQSIQYTKGYRVHKFLKNLKGYRVHKGYRLNRYRTNL